ncbi:Putative permease [Halorhabdus sp. SVX81]|uniref:AEC family transporter n=1 Tax=Halorhabdus sp. SVX81 TaxID=2978283 RepID=UPI0023DA0A95|nr:AEC family transporter [Halorhabdus sp. SVX81]WEL18001.1 Putative permease [Halorhabdus sp. SVX81]
MFGIQPSSLLGIFGTAILPIIAIAAAGFVLGRVKDVEAGPLNTITVYVLVPALVFHTLVKTPMSVETVLLVAVGVLAVTLVMLAIAGGVGRLAGRTEPLLGAFVLTAAFANSGNFGIPLSEFAFGATGRKTAVLYAAVQGVLLYTLGTYVAARGSGGALAGVRRAARIPLVYAVIVALGVRWLGLAPPTGSAAMETLRLVGDSSIPVMLLILGIQLSGTDYGAAIGQVGLSNLLKLTVAPVVAVGIAFVLGFENQTVARVFILESAGPTAVTPIILLGEFSEHGDGPIGPAEFASTAILTSTLLSIPILTVLIALLRAGVVI